MAKTKKNPFWVVLIYHERVVKEGIEDFNSKLVRDAYVVLATDQNQAQLLASREIPKELVEHLDDIEVIVTPFF